VIHNTVWSLLLGESKIYREIEVVNMWWTTIIVVALLAFGIVGFVSMVRLFAQRLTGETTRGAEDMYDQYADSPRERHRRSLAHAATAPVLPNRVPNSPLRFAARSWGLASGDVTEAGRTVNASGSVSLGDHIISAGLPLTGQRVTLRPGGPVARILAGGVLVRTVACPVPPGAHAARPSRLPSDPTPSRSPSSLAAPSPRPGPLAATSDGTRHRNTADDRRRAEPGIGR